MELTRGSGYEMKEMQNFWRRGVEPEKREENADGSVSEEWERRGGPPVKTRGRGRKIKIQEAVHSRQIKTSKLEVRSFTMSSRITAQGWKLGECGNGLEDTQWGPR